nr:MAG TPA: hypothetical protein [Caudoviricetes sp.]
MRFYLAVTKLLLTFVTVKTENNVLKQGRDDIKPRTYYFVGLIFMPILQTTATKIWRMPSM